MRDIQSEPGFHLFSHASLDGLGKMAKKPDYIIDLQLFEIRV